MVIEKRSLTPDLQEPSVTSHTANHLLFELSLGCRPSGSRTSWSGISPSNLVMPMPRWVYHQLLASELTSCRYINATIPHVPLPATTNHIPAVKRRVRNVRGQVAAARWCFRGQYISGNDVDKELNARLQTCVICRLPRSRHSHGHDVDRSCRQ